MGRIFPIVVGRPQDPSFEKDRLMADAIIDSTSLQLQSSNGCQVLPRPTNGRAKTSRGNFKTASVGVSYSGGQKVCSYSNSHFALVPSHLFTQYHSNLCHIKHNQKVLQALFVHPSVRMIANFCKLQVPAQWKRLVLRLHDNPSAALAFFAQKLHEYYHLQLKQLRHHSKPSNALWTRDGFV